MGEKFYKIEQNLMDDPIEVEAETFSMGDHGELYLLRKPRDGERVDWGDPTYGKVVVAIFPKGCWTALIACYRDLQKEHP